MKKILALVLALLMCVSCLAIFASCNVDTPDDKNDPTDTQKPTEKPTEAPEAPATLEAAKTFLFSMYKDSASPKNDYDIVGKVMIGTTAFEVTWTVDSDKISIKESSKEDFWTVDLPDANAEEFEYVLTATIKNAAGETIEVSIKRTMAVIDNTGLVTAPVADVAYKLFVEQVTLGQKLYALNTTQKDEGKYINTTNDPKAANDYFVEVVDGGFKFYTTDANGAKLYVHAHTVKTDDGKVSRCSLTPFIDSFCIRELSYTYDWELELMLRMTHAKLDCLGKKQVYADADICGFGFEPYKDGISVAKELVLPKHCKE